MHKKVLTAMSGGVDSSVAAYLLKTSGYEQIGAMMKLYADEILPETCDLSNAKGCCSLADSEDARAVSEKLGIPFYVLNFTDIFADEVMERFVAAYQRGQTPNPCIDCNRFVKFQKLLGRAQELECQYIATGHYARIEATPGGRFLLKTGQDETKDQSYVLYAMTQSQLARTLLPVGALTKNEVREIAEQQGFINAQKRDSQDICFAPDGDYAGFIARFTHTPATPGNFVDVQGNVIGRHQGLIHYTIGQRKGLGIYRPEPTFVLSLNTKDNSITVGDNHDLFTKDLTATDINLIPFDRINTPMKVQAKIRYAHKAAAATVWQDDDDTFHVTFDEAQRAITPGQAIVLYDGDIVIGGGTIMNKEKNKFSPC